MATTYRIHPAIGIARVGNSPDEFFIGPERAVDRPEPQGGFKDAQCRVKRQAARFRVFAHHDDGTVEEITADLADISWTVHVANKKAAYPGRGNTESAGDLTIDPGSRTLSVPDAFALFDTGSIHFTGQAAVAVPLGEMRTDDAGRLLVLGGKGKASSPAGNAIGSFWGNAGWYDDISDGPVTASITLHGSGDTPAVEGAWVIVTPPKFAPHQDSVTTLYDRLQRQMITSGHLVEPMTTSYTKDIYPILQRARRMKWVEAILGAHTWPDPVTSQPVVDAIFARVAGPSGGDMPALNGSDSAVTATQYAHLQRWKNGTYAADWAGVPAPEPAVTPQGMDRAALDACTGGAFYPGIEAGGLSPGSRPILEKPYTAAFRIDHSASSAGDISASMALPWQADFKACGDSWWPVPRPNDVFASPGGASLRWDRDVMSMDEMVEEWNKLGFVVRQGSDHLEVQHCDEQSIALLTPRLDFVDVDQGPMNMVREVPLAISFEVVSPGSAVTLEYAPNGAPNHAQLVTVNTSVTVGPTAANAVATARLWVIYRTDAVGTAIPTQSVTVREPISGRTWQITIDGNTVARATTATAFALDRSGSMNDDRGDGQTKHDSLQQAANMFVDLMLSGDGAGIARFNHDGQVLQPILQLGTGGLSDLNRAATHDVIDGNGLDPSGATSIGDGIFEARGLLNAAAGYDRKALVVLTDGIENSARWIADVSSQIDATTYAVGFGQPHTISVRALQTITGNNGGYLLTTGAIVGDQRFLLQKYFLQILGGINNTEVILDPNGTLVRGEVQRIPFRVSDADAGIEVVLLTPNPNIVDFRLQTPNGLLIEPWLANSNPAIQFQTTDGASFYRLALPTQLVPQRFDQAGTWHAILTIGKPRTDPELTEPDLSILAGQQPVSRDRPVRRPTENQRRFELAGRGSETLGLLTATHVAGAASHQRRPVPYSVVVHAYSSVTLRVDVDQGGYRPGNAVTLRASLTQSGVPLTDAVVWAEVRAPGGATTTVALQADPDIEGHWNGGFNAATPGVYAARVRARGRTRSGVGFVRERTLTATAWRGADQPGDPGGYPNGGGGGGGCSLCDLLTCLVGERGVLDERLLKRLAESGIDLDRLRRCLATRCQRDKDESELR